MRQDHPVRKRSPGALLVHELLLTLGAIIACSIVAAVGWAKRGRNDHTKSQERILTEPPESFLASAWSAMIAVPVLGTAIWGALGGATNALVIRVTARQALRHIALGAAIAAGLGGIAAPLLRHWLGLPAGVLTGADGAAGGSLAYLTGSLGAAAFEAILTRIRSEGLGDDDKTP